MFTWVPMHREAIHRILEHRRNQRELLTILREMAEQGLKVISLQDECVNSQSTPSVAIDPFTFLASFNRRIADKHRRDNWAFLKARWGLQAPVPNDFAGIPLHHNLASWRFPSFTNRVKACVDYLWQVASLAADGDLDEVGEELFNRGLRVDRLPLVTLTVGLFWINPEKFLHAHPRTLAYGKSKGVTTIPMDYRTYGEWLKEITDRIGRNYLQVSYEANRFATRQQSQPGIKGPCVPSSELDKITTQYLEDMLRDASQQ